MTKAPDQYDHRIVLDTEFYSPDGEKLQAVHCVVATDEVTGQWWKLGPADLAGMKRPPWPTGDRVLHIGYGLAAEWEAYSCLGWQVPRTDCLDLFYEFMVWKNCVRIPQPPPSVKPNGMLNACYQFGIATMDTAHKDRMRDACMGGPVLPAEAVQPVIDYCVEDVENTARLFRKMLPVIRRWPQSINRGRFAEVQAAIQTTGVPIDVETHDKLVTGLPQLEASAIDRAVDAGFNIFHTESGEIDQLKFARYLTAHRIPWGRTDKGHLATDKDTFEEVAAARPEFNPVLEVLTVQKLSHTLVTSKRRGLRIGQDGRHRFYPAPFASSTGRSQPSGNIFALPKGARSLIQPTAGMAFGQADWKSQEVGVSAALSGDAALMAVFDAEDPYLKAAIMCGMAPEGATKASHGRIRAMFKVALLAWLYGAGGNRIAAGLGISPIEGQDICNRFKKAFPVYAAWAESMANHGITVGELETIHGWRRGCRWDPKRFDGSVNPLSLTNFAIQGGGADLMRSAAVLALRNGVTVCATVHDAICFEAAAEEIGSAAKIVTACMKSVCHTFLKMNGRVDVTLAVSPDRYRDEDGQPLWRQITTELGVAEV